MNKPGQEEFENAVGIRAFRISDLPVINQQEEIAGGGIGESADPKTRTIFLPAPSQEDGCTCETNTDVYGRLHAKSIFTLSFAGRTLEVKRKAPWPTLENDSPANF